MATPRLLVWRRTLAALLVAACGVLTAVLVIGPPPGQAASRARSYVSAPAIKAAQSTVVKKVNAALDKVLTKTTVKPALTKVATTYRQSKPAFLAGEQQFLTKSQSAGLKLVAGTATPNAVRTTITNAGDAWLKQMGPLGKAPSLGDLVRSFTKGEIGFFNGVQGAADAYGLGALTQNAMVKQVQESMDALSKQFLGGVKSVVSPAGPSAIKAVTKLIGLGGASAIDLLGGAQLKLLDSLGPVTKTVTVTQTATATVTTTTTVSMPVAATTASMRCMVAGAGVNVQGSVRSGGSGLAGAGISFTATGPGGTVTPPGAVTTDATGAFATTFHPPSGGAFELQGQYAGDASHGTASASCSVDVP